MDAGRGGVMSTKELAFAIIIVVLVVAWFLLRAHG